MSTNRPSSRHSNKNSTVSSKGDDNLSNARQRQTKRDEAIRRKAETDLKKKRNPNHSTSQRHSKRVPGTVSALRPSPALTVNSTIKVTEASQMMAAKRADCVLVVDEDEHLAGIFTAKDLAYRVVAEGLDARTTTVANIMTPNPLCVTSDASATDALNTMVQRGFRHLPVCNEEGDIVGLLDITKCLYDALDKMDRAYGSSRKLYDALEGVEKEWAMQAPQFLQLMGSLKDQINCPDVTTVLDGTLPADISPKTSVREAAKAMKAIRTTAVLVTENDSITGIFTSKDIVLRVIAAQLDPSNCSVVRVMTPHPDTALPDTTILDALKRMHNGHYLNLPIVDEFKQVVGMVDVLKLTYATLEQINNLQGQEGDGSGPMWSKFWSTALAGEDESTISDSMTSNQQTQGASEVYPHESVSAIDEDPTLAENASKTFVFKFKAPSGKVYRINALDNNFQQLRDNIVGKLIEESPETEPSAIPPICYADDEGDLVLLLHDDDLKDAVQLARQNGWQRIILSLAENPEIPKDETIEKSTHESEVSRKATQTPVISEPIEEPAKVQAKVATEEKAVVPQKTEPLIPENLVIPVAVGSGVLVALIGVFIVMKATSR